MPKTVNQDARWLEIQCLSDIIAHKDGAKDGVWVASTPGMTYLAETESHTEAGAWKKLLKVATHMPYRGIEGFKERGYTVDYWQRI